MIVAQESMRWSSKLLRPAEQHRTNQRIMGSCINTASRIWMCVFGSFYTWSLVQRTKVNSLAGYRAL